MLFFFLPLFLIFLMIGLPVFFEVGFVLLIPIAFNVAKRTGKSLLVVGLPMVAGLSVVHGLIPPHPAALLAVQQYGADIGKTIAFGLIVGVPTAIPLVYEFDKRMEPRRLPGAAAPLRGFSANRPQRHQGGAMGVQ